jgi:hypothetical protein
MMTMSDMQWPGVPAPIPVPVPALQGYGDGAHPGAWGTWFLYFGIGATLGGYVFNNRIMTVVGMGAAGYGVYRTAQGFRLW